MKLYKNANFVHYEQTRLMYLNVLLAELLGAHAAIGGEDLDPARPLAGVGGPGDLSLVLVPTQVLPGNVR